MTPKEEERERLANRLKEYRKRLALSQQELAKKVNKPQTVISSWERGVGAPDANELPMLAKALEVSYDDICGSPSTKSKDRELLDAFHNADEITQRNVKLLLGIKEE